MNKYPELAERLQEFREETRKILMAKIAEKNLPNIVYSVMAVTFAGCISPLKADAQEVWQYTSQGSIQERLAE